MHRKGWGVGKVAQTATAQQAESAGQNRHRARNRWLVAMGAGVGVLFVGLAIAGEYIVRHAGPLLRSSVVETLSARFHSPVELDSLEISMVKGLAVHGRGLRILYLAGPTEPDIVQQRGGAAPPMLSVKSFKFQTTLSDLLHLRANLARVDVDGMELHIPPNSRGEMEPSKTPKARIALTAAKIYCRNVKVFIETSAPGKGPVQIDIKSLELTDVGAGQPLVYVADVINPEPIGMVHASGHFGPWEGADPRSTALNGSYVLEKADLGSIKGLRGVLTSNGTFQGRLGRLTVEGATSTPNFALDVSGHAMPLETTFSAFVDGTTGDTTLNMVRAQLAESRFSCSGGIKKVPGKGHDIALTVLMPQGRIEDILRLVMKPAPTVMRGAVSFDGRLHVPPGNVRVAEKMQLTGNLQMRNVEFTSAKLQKQVDSLSLRAQGKPKEAKEVAAGPVAEVKSEMAATFSLANAMLMVRSLEYQIPGAKVNLVGVYPLNGGEFDFRGHVQTDATASEMLTGWKSLLMKPFNGLLQKGTTGANIPIEISGSHDNFNVGFAMHNEDKTPEEILADLGAKSKELDARSKENEQSQPH